MIDKESHTAQMVRQDIENALGVESQAFLYREFPSDCRIDDMCVDRAATAMKEKLAKKRGEGRGRWWDRFDCKTVNLRQMLRDHIEKGDPIDVMNIAMMLYCRGDSTASPMLTATTAGNKGVATVGANDNPTPPAHTHAAAINLFAADCHAASRKAGWYTDPNTGRALDRNVPEMLCLIHSEISEAMEGYRKNLQDDKLPARKMIEVELADAMVRIGDLATYLGLDVGGAIVEKMAFNATREDHKLEARKAAGGKAF